MQVRIWPITSFGSGERNAKRVFFPSWNLCRFPFNCVKYLYLLLDLILLEKKILIPPVFRCLVIEISRLPFSSWGEFGLKIYIVFMGKSYSGLLLLQKSIFSFYVSFSSFLWYTPPLLSSVKIQKVPYETSWGRSWMPHPSSKGPRVYLR